MSSPPPTHPPTHILPVKAKKLVAKQTNKTIEIDCEGELATFMGHVARAAFLRILDAIVPFRSETREVPPPLKLDPSIKILSHFNATQDPSGQVGVYFYMSLRKARSVSVFLRLLLVCVFPSVCLFSVCSSFPVWLSSKAFLPHSLDQSL